MTTETRGTSFRSDFGDIAIIGLGPIGASEILYLTAIGHRCIGVDPSANARANAVDPAFLSERSDLDRETVDRCVKLFRTVGSIHDLPTSVSTFVICVPTEKDGQPTLDLLNDVLTTILQKCNQLRTRTRLLVESTVIPGYYEDFVAKLVERLYGSVLAIDYGYSPRRDWFLSSERTARGTHRVLSGNTKSAMHSFEALLHPAWPHLVMSEDITAVEVAKLFENAVRYVSISFAHEIARAFPKVNIDHAFELAGSKWNIERYYNSLSVGGYCTPTSVRYLQKSALCEYPLQFASLAEQLNRSKIEDCVQFIEGHSVRRIAIIGLRYRPPFRSTVDSAAIRLAKGLMEKRINVFAFDSLIFDASIEFGDMQRLTADNRDLDAVLLHVVSTDDEKRIAECVASVPGILIIDNREDQSRPSFSGLNYISTRHSVLKME